MAIYTIFRIGSFSGCYLTSIQYNIENSFTPEGYPHTVSATVSFESMDMCFVGPYGEFFQRGFGNQAQNTSNQWQTFVKNAQGAVEGVMNTADTYANSLTNSTIGLPPIFRTGR